MSSESISEEGTFLSSAGIWTYLSTCASFLALHLEPWQSLGLCGRSIGLCGRCFGVVRLVLPPHFYHPYREVPLISSDSLLGGTFLSGVWLDLPFNFGFILVFVFFSILWLAGDMGSCFGAACVSCNEGRRPKPTFVSISTLFCSVRRCG